MQRSLGEFEQLDQITDAAAKIKGVNERATLFRITSNAMINVSISFELFQLGTVPISGQLSSFLYYGFRYF